jgi:hypothetical protein
MAAELQVMIDAVVTGLGTDTDVRNKIVASVVPTNAVKMKPIISVETNLSVLTNITTSLMAGVYVKAISGEVFAAMVSAAGVVSLRGYKIAEGEAMFVNICSALVGATYQFALSGSLSTTQAEVMVTKR